MTLPRRLRATALALAAVSAVSAPAAEAQNAAPPPGCTGTPSDTWLTVITSGLRSGSGQLAVTLYADNSRKFLVRHGSLYVGRVPATQGTTRACIFVPQPGVYALAIYHDENANEKFDRTTIGFPAEGYGFSNNPSTLAGLPAFRSVRLNVSRAGLSTRVQLKYP